MEEETDNRTQTEHLEGILKRSDKCYEFFTGEYELNHEDFKYQLKQLVIMSYMQLMHFQKEFLNHAEGLDREESLAISNQKRIDNVSGVESADPVPTGEDQLEPATESADPADAGEDLVAPLSVSAEVCSIKEEDSLEVSNTASQDSEVSVFSLREDPDTGNILEQRQCNSVSQRESPLLSGQARDPEAVRVTDPIISSILKTIKRVAPNLRFKPKHLRRKKFKVVPFEFASVWRNLPSIFSDVEVHDAAECSLPTIAWEKVNVSGIKKLPKPERFSILSVSQDPKFYLKNCSCEKTKKGILCSCNVCGTFEAQYLREYPHGFISGVQTNLGVIPIPRTPMFGHVWDEASFSWLLHAEIAPYNTTSADPDYHLTSYRRRRGPDRRRTRGTTRRTGRRR